MGIILCEFLEYYHNGEITKNELLMYALTYAFRCVSDSPIEMQDYKLIDKTTGKILLEL